MIFGVIKNNHIHTKSEYSSLRGGWKFPTNLSNYLSAVQQIKNM